LGEKKLPQKVAEKISFVSWAVSGMKLRQDDDDDDLRSRDKNGSLIFFSCQESLIEKNFLLSASSLSMVWCCEWTMVLALKLVTFDLCTSTYCRRFFKTLA